jgi:hypothetical protein
MAHRKGLRMEGMDVKYKFIFDEKAGRAQISFSLVTKTKSHANLGALMGRCKDIKRVEAAERDFNAEVREAVMRALGALSIEVFYRHGIPVAPVAQDAEIVIGKAPISGSVTRVTCAPIPAIQQLTPGKMKNYLDKGYKKDLTRRLGVKRGCYLDPDFETNLKAVTDEIEKKSGRRATNQLIVDQMNLGDVRNLQRRKKRRGGHSISK